MFSEFAIEYSLFSCPLLAKTFAVASAISLRKVNADLVAIPTHGRTGLAHFFEGSISEDLANHANLPVMTFKIMK